MADGFKTKAEFQAIDGRLYINGCPASMDQTAEFEKKYPGLVAQSSKPGKTGIKMTIKPDGEVVMEGNGNQEIKYTRPAHDTQDKIGFDFKIDGEIVRHLMMGLVAIAGIWGLTHCTGKDGAVVAMLISSTAGVGLFALYNWRT